MAALTKNQLLYHLFADESIAKQDNGPFSLCAFFCTKCQPAGAKWITSSNAASTGAGKVFRLAVLEHDNKREEAVSSLTDESSSWDSISEVLAGFNADQVSFLTAARELELVYPLLHALTRGSLGEFMVRVAALEALVAEGRSPLTPAEIGEILYWLKEPARDLVMRTLRGSGWLAYEPIGGYRVTDAGQFVATVLSFLRAQVRQGDLLPTVEGIEYMLRLGVDPLRHILLLRSRLEDLRSGMESARNSHSEVILRKEAARLQDALSLSERIRAVLARVPLEMSEARRTAHDIHDLLSRLHGVGSDLHAAITEVGRQYLHLVAGLSTTDIIATLMQLPIDELAAAARSALRPVAKRPPFVIPELLCAEAEAYLSRQLYPPATVEWKEPPEPESEDARSLTQPEVEQLLDDLDRLVASGQREELAHFIPKDTASVSFLRVTLLPLLAEKIGGEGVAGRLSSLPIRVTIEGDGFPISAPAPLMELSPGTISNSDGSKCNE